MNQTEKIHPAAAIFDMDGLMLDTEKPTLDMWIKVGKLNGWDIEPELIMRTLGIDKPGTKVIIYGALGSDFPYDTLRDEVNSRVKEIFENGISLKPGLIVLLDHLSGLGVKLAVATSTRRETAQWKLQKAGILDRFDAFAFGDEITNGKPAPDIFLLAAERLGKAPSECVGFEDSPAGHTGLHAAGIRSVFVKDLVDLPPEVNAKVWHRCSDLAEAIHLFI